MLACVDSDAENIFICLTARELRSDITIVARASVEDSEKKLLRAGADRVISPYKSSGAEMARLALQPQVTGVVDVAPEYRMEEIEVAEGCAAEGQDDRRGARHHRRSSRSAAPTARCQPQPAADTVLRAGDVARRDGHRRGAARSSRRCSRRARRRVGDRLRLSPASSAEASCSSISSGEPGLDPSSPWLERLAVEPVEQ